MRTVLLASLVAICACNAGIDITQDEPSVTPDSGVNPPDANHPTNHPDSGSKDGGSDSAPTPPVPHCGDEGMPKCSLNEGCRKHSDCTSDACTYAGKCTSEKSCTGHFGGDTCGVGETGEAGAKHSSCCETAALFGELSNVQMDRWLITAGRMRAFIDHVNGDVRSFVHTLPGNVWQDSYDEFVPANMDEANIQLGSFFSKKSCHPGDFTGRTYWTPPTADDFSDFTKDQLDEKALNCVTWHLVTAFCAWDGGRMATANEIRNAFTNGGQYVQPWLWQPGAVQYSQPAEYVSNTPATNTFNHAFGYNFPDTKVRPNPNVDIAYHISPPGRYPQSWNEHGHEIAGNLLEWNAGSPFVFSATYSWENHGGDSVGDSNWRDFQAVDAHAPNGYYAIGGRCSH